MAMTADGDRPAPAVGLSPGPVQAGEDGSGIDPCLEKVLDSAGDSAFQWPGASAWVACFCAAALLLTLGGYIRTHSAALENARELSSEILSLKQQVGELGGQVQEINRRLSRLEEQSRWPVDAQGIQAAIARWVAEADADDNLPPLPPKAESLPLTTSASGGAAAVETAAGEITGVNWPAKRVMVDRGRKDGLVPGRRLSVHRGDAWIGDVRVATVFEASAAGQVESSLEEFRIGDAVRMSAAEPPEPRPEQGRGVK